MLLAPFPFALLVSGSAVNLLAILVNGSDFNLHSTLYCWSLVLLVNPPLHHQPPMVIRDGAINSPPPPALLVRGRAHIPQQTPCFVGQ